MDIKFLYNSNKYLPLVAIAFLLPFNFGVAILLVVSLLFFFVFSDLKANMKRLFSNKWTYICFAFFLMHAIAWFFTDNREEANRAIEIKLGFFAFPLLIFSQDYNRIDLRKAIKFFAYGTLAVTFFNIMRAVYYYFTLHETKYFYYSDFSFFMHSGYYAMYAVFAIVVLCVVGINFFKNNVFNILLITLLSAFLGMGIYLSSSKMGLISAIVIIPIILFNQLFRQRKFKLLIGIGLLLIVALVFIFSSNSMPVARLKSAFNVVGDMKSIDKTTSESNAVRVLIWSQAAKIINENLLTGVGPGDVNDHLYRAYDAEGMTGANEKKLNSHNQFLQSTMGLGIPGLIVLLALTIGVLIIGLVERDLLKWLFGFLVVLNFAVESMLETQAGTLFFLFFMVLLSVPMKLSTFRFTKAIN